MKHANHYPTNPKIPLILVQKILEPGLNWFTDFLDGFRVLYFNQVWSCAICPKVKRIQINIRLIQNPFNPGSENYLNQD